jgi:hypothetical protein
VRSGLGQSYVDPLSAFEGVCGGEIAADVGDGLRDFARVKGAAGLRHSGLPQSEQCKGGERGSDNHAHLSRIKRNANVRKGS